MRASVASEVGKGVRERTGLDWVRGWASLTKVLSFSRDSLSLLMISNLIEGIAVRIWFTSNSVSAKDSSPTPVLTPRLNLDAANHCPNECEWVWIKVLASTREASSTRDRVEGLQKLGDRGRGGGGGEGLESESRLLQVSNE